MVRNKKRWREKSKVEQEAGLAHRSLAVCPGVQLGQVTCLSQQVGPTSPSVTHSWMEEQAGGQVFVQNGL